MNLVPICSVSIIQQHTLISCPVEQQGQDIHVNVPSGSNKKGNDIARTGFSLAEDA